jgi:WXG100 family type VII secretion target
MCAEHVRVNHDALDTIANRFQQQSDTLGGMMSELQGSYRPLKEDGWMGEGANAFFAEMEELLFPAVQKLVDALAEATLVTKAVSELMSQADNQASTGFRNAAEGGASGANAGSGAGMGNGAGMGGYEGNGALSGGGGGGYGGAGSYGGSGAGSYGDYSSPSGWSAGAGSGGMGSSSYMPAGGSGSGYGFPGSGGANEAERVPARYHYQSAGAGDLGGAASGAGGLAYGLLETIMPALGGGSGLPIMLAAATPLIALLGRVMKKNFDEARI